MKQKEVIVRSFNPAGLAITEASELLLSIQKKYTEKLLVRTTKEGKWEIYYLEKKVKQHE
jgi:hypothetical protein